MAVNVNVVSTFDPKGLDKAQRDLDALRDKTQTTSDKLSSIGKTIGASIAGVGATIAGFAIAQTSKLEDSQAALENAFKNAGTSMEDQKSALANVQGKLEKIGYSNAEVNDEVARMTTVTGDATKAMGMMQTAADIAANRHIDLASAGDLLSKVMAGSTTAAKKMGIAVPDSISKIQDPAQKAQAMMELLQGHFKGSAAAAADTFKGKMEATKAQLSDTAAKIGSKLIPIIMELVDKLMGFSKWVGKHKEIMIALATLVIGALGTMAVMWVINTIEAMTFWTAATGGIIILVAALAAGIAWIVTHWSAVWQFIKDIAAAAWHWLYDNVIHPIVKAFEDAWGAIRGAFKAVWDWLANNWPLILAIITGPIGLAVLFIVDNWNSIIGFFKGAIDTIGGIFSSIGDAIVGAFKAAFNFVAHIWNETVGKLHFSIPGWVPGIGGDSFGVPNIPEFRAMGGPVTAGSPYIVGEAGPELFVPSNSGSIVSNNQLGGPMNVTINVTTNDPQAVVNALRQWMQRNGTLAGAGIK